MSKQDVKHEIQQKMLSNSMANPDVFTPISDKTVKRYMITMESSERDGKIKPESRVEPFLNIRNPISKAAGLMALNRVCPTENMHNENEVGIFLFGWHQTKTKACFD